MNTQPWPDKCSVCGKSFRGHEPLTDGKDRYFHKKCAPTVDPAEMAAGVVSFMGTHGVEGVEFCDEEGRRRGGFKIPPELVKKPKEEGC